MRAAAQKGYATATDLADYMVKKACPSATRTRPWPMP
jgi:argininosuccinate lyase